MRRASVGRSQLPQHRARARRVWPRGKGTQHALGDGSATQTVTPKGEGFEAFPLGPLLPDLELGYAGTVHRAQGSEFDRVAVILPREDSPLMTREILYTALTRARKSAVILGSREILEGALARRIQRQTLLRALLA